MERLRCNIDIELGNFKQLAFVEYQHELIPKLLNRNMVYSTLSVIRVTVYVRFPIKNQVIASFVKEKCLYSCMETANSLKFLEVADGYTYL